MLGLWTTGMRENMEEEVSGMIHFIQREVKGAANNLEESEFI